MKPKLTIGMAAAGDFDGPAFTVQALRLYHPDVIDDCEILVVDNTPETKIGERLKRFCGKTGARYVPFPEPKGTAAPRGRIFEQAVSENVLCLDSHVLLAPGVIERLIKWMEDEHEPRDLLSGPIIWDDLDAAYASSRAMATHFQPAWGAGMWGQWALDERGVNDRAEPFEIGMMGLGLFACRRDAFPGFNERMVGFGGEEGYLHEKVRRNGGRNLCLPWLRWWHRFNEFVPGAAPYVATVEDKAWNYCVGWGELDWDLAPVREHFATIMPPARFDQIAEAAERGDALPPHRLARREEGRAAMPSGGLGGTIMRTDDEPVDTGGVDAKEDCGCGSARPAAPPAEPAEVVNHAEQLRPFVERIGAAGILYEHAAIGSPATAMLADLHPGRVYSFSTRHGRSAFEAYRKHGKERVTIVSAELKAPAYEADLIVLSGYGNGRDLAPHMEAAGAKSRRLIGVLGTNQADTKETPGLMTAARMFLREHPEWSVVSKNSGGHGLAILSKDAADKPELPPIGEQGRNFVAAAMRNAGEAIKGGQIAAAPELVEARLSVCAGCEWRNGDRCSSCGCYLAAKTKLRREDCPEGRWPSPQALEQEDVS